MKFGGILLGVLVLFVTLVAARGTGTNLRRWALIVLFGAFGVALVVTGYHSALGH